MLLLTLTWNLELGTRNQELFLPASTAQRFNGIPLFRFYPSTLLPFYPFPLQRFNASALFHDGRSGRYFSNSLTRAAS